MKIETKWISSLEKVFPDEIRNFYEENSSSTLLGEKFHMQLAVFSEDSLRDELTMEIDSPIKEYIKAYIVKSVPVMLTTYPWSDNDFLRKNAGLFPDLLIPFDIMTMAEKQWRSIFFEVDIPEDLDAGIYPIKVTLYDKEKNPAESATYNLEIINATLPEQTLKYTDWFHNDCLCQYYNVPIFSDEYWCITENYIKNAAEYGINMLLTPIFTPPLDTVIGGERLTVQLVDMKHNNGDWEFDYTKLERYINIALSNGIRYFEFSHLFSQWGANAAPKIIYEENGNFKKFGWDTPALSKEYLDFLFSFIPSLKEEMKSLGLLENCYFHISDEPQLKDYENYSKVYSTVAPLLSDCNVIDALSDYEFYSNGIIKNPIPSNDRAEQFFKNGVGSRWTYYCCGQQDKVSNRMMAMPSYRTRILGTQLFKYQAEGFLQWGYNFWLNELSRKLINPFFCTDCEDTYPSGDAFIVYPGDDGNPLPSIREFVFFDALQDMRALQLLASLTSFEETVALVEKIAGMNITFSEYPREIGFIVNLRKDVNEQIKKHIACR